MGGLLLYPVARYGRFSGSTVKVRIFDAYLKCIAGK